MAFPARKIGQRWKLHSVGAFAGVYKITGGRPGYWVCLRLSDDYKCTMSITDPALWTLVEDVKTKKNKETKMAKKSPAPKRYVVINESAYNDDPQYISAASPEEAAKLFLMEVDEAFGRQSLRIIAADEIPEYTVGMLVTKNSK